MIYRLQSSSDTRLHFWHTKVHFMFAIIPFELKEYIVSFLNILEDSVILVALAPSLTNIQPSKIKQSWIKHTVFCNCSVTWPGYPSVAVIEPDKPISDNTLKEVRNFVTTSHHVLFSQCEDYTVHTVNAVVHSWNRQPAVTSSNDAKHWFRKGRLHRDNDRPAIENQGSRHWFQNGQLHRDNDLPAFECATGGRSWFKNGERHRDNDLPAETWGNGCKVWWRHGQRHRDNDLPAVELADGTKQWWVDGHRTAMS